MTYDIDDVSSLYFHEVEVLNAYWRTSDRITAALARALGVRVRSRLNFPATASVHPTAAVAFDRAQRAVYFAAPRAHVRLFLPHEVIHVVWPDTHMSGPEEEWDSGMIDYELAWLQRLCTTPRARECLDAWSAYAGEGGVFGKDTRTKARETVALAGIPSPWST